MKHALLTLSVALGLLLAGKAEATAFSFGATGAVVGSDQIGLRPGLRLGLLPTPSTAVEAVFDGGLRCGCEADLFADAFWDAGLALAGRYYPSPALEPGEGIFLLGRLTVGVSGDGEHLGPWTGLSGGFGLRTNSWLNIEASVGPEWAMSDGARWRTELGLAFILDPEAGPDTVKHRVKRRPR